MPILKTLLTIVLLCPSLSFASSTNLFTLHRVNYKPYKQLRYDLNYNSKTCEIDTKRALNVFYENIASNEALSEFSSNSKKYFSPKITKVSKTQLSFTFLSLEEMKKQLGSGAKLTVYLDHVNDRCEVTSELAYQGKAFDLNKITVNVRKTFGIPTGVEWVLLEGVNNGSYYSHKIKE